MLAAAPSGAGQAELRRLVLESNVAGKSSATSRTKLWRQLRQRYSLDINVPEYQALLAALRLTGSPRERGLICFLMLARNDRLFRELTLACVSRLLARQGAVVASATVDEYLADLAAERRFSWTRETAVTVRQHALSALKDFGLLTGAVVKHTNTPQPGPNVTLFAARLARLEGLTDRQIIGSRWFGLLGLTPAQVIDLLYAAAREGVLGFRMQAEVVELTLPPLEES
ncbi:MAG: DUF1819 family protein [Bacteroidetes bacterium]|nr:DUF1819 family protein [Bacteroidota bacterium]